MLLRPLRSAGHLLRSKAGNPVTKNSGYLYAIQFFDIPLSLITIPYLVRVLTPHGFGLASFALSLATYFSLLIDYGFAYSATRKLAQARDYPEKASRIVSAVFGAKLLIAIACLAFLVVISYTVPRIEHDRLIFFASFGIVLGNLVYPLWIFQGMENMKAISLVTIAGKAISTLLIFTLVASPEDSLAYLVILGGSQLAIGTASTIAAYRTFALSPVVPRWKAVIAELKEGFAIFLSTTSANLYAYSNAFVLGLFAPNAVVGYYAGAEKLVRTSLVAINPVIQAVYPMLSRLATTSEPAVVRFGKKLLFGIGSVGAAISALLFLFAEPVVTLILGNQYQEATPLLRILSPLPLLLAISTVLGIQILLPLKRDRSYMKILIAATALCTGIAFVFAPRHQGTGAALALLFTEAFVATALLLYVKLRLPRHIKPE